MAAVSIRNTGKKVFCREGENLLEVLLREGIFIDNPCGGKGTCGKCKVKLYQGVRAAEKTDGPSHGAEAEGNICLSCLTEVSGDMEVELLQTKKRHRVLTKGYVPEFQRDHFDGGYGIAIDIGTTTVVTALIELATGAEAGAAAAVNAQKHFGLDVLTRITYEYEHMESGIKELQKAIVDSLNAMIKEVCEEAGVNQEEIWEITVAANCTMTHMLLGTDARSIGRSPYKPLFTKARRLKASAVGIQAPCASLYCLPHVSAYIGADIVAGTYVCGLQRKKSQNVLFIDIGTNGEIVLANQGRLICCSCAAGPALEGMNISFGMGASDGAIEDIRITEKGVEITTIGQDKPIGICGSGILAAVKELLRTGIVKKTGAFIKREALKEDDYRYPLLRMNGKKRAFVLREKPEMLVTQGDVRQVQLAKGAILSGIRAMMNQAGIGIKDLDQVMIAGQFGSHLPAELLTGTGILPEETKDKVVYVGNSSKTGAYMSLLSKEVKRELEALACEMEYIELAETENYERIFAESMIFPSFVSR